MADRQGSDGRDAGGKGPDNGLDDRLRKLDAELAARKTADDNRKAGGAPKDASGWGNAMRLSSEFISAVLVGAALGWAIDYWAGTRPWGLIVFLLLGFAAGVVNVMRATGQVAEFGQRRGDGNE